VTDSKPTAPSSDLPAAHPARTPRKHFQTGRKRDKSLKHPRVLVAEVVDESACKPLTHTDQERPTHTSQPPSSRDDDRLKSNHSYSRGQSIRRARELMIANAEKYARKHIESVERAMELAHVDPRYLESARRASEFALTHVSADGERVVDKPTGVQAPTLPAIQIGVMLGGMPTIQRKQLTSADD
jgi:hypothetical protein